MQRNSHCIAMDAWPSLVGCGAQNACGQTLNETNVLQSRRHMLGLQDEHNSMHSQNTCGHSSGTCNVTFHNIGSPAHDQIYPHILHTLLGTNLVDVAVTKGPGRRSTHEGNKGHSRCAHNLAPKCANQGARMGHAHSMLTQHHHRNASNN
jgi:hypothetical protein